MADARWMRAAIALGRRGRGRTAPNPNVGCIIVKDGRAIGRGWTSRAAAPMPKPSRWKPPVPKRAAPPLM